MTLELTIDKKVLTAKPSFGFARTADEKYGTYVKEIGRNKSGVNNILAGIVEGDVEAVVKFFDCGFAHLAERPTTEQIEEALEARIEKDGDVEPLLNDIYKAFATAGFFKKTTKEFWKNMELMQDFGATEAEKEQNRKAYDMMMERKTELKAHLTTNN